MTYRAFTRTVAEYNRLHAWVRRSKPYPDACEHCGRTERKLEWANKSHECLWDLDDWLGLCRSCHRVHDRADTCQRGHLRSPENTKANGACRICLNVVKKEWARRNRLQENAARRARAARKRATGLEKVLA